MGANNQTVPTPIACRTLATTRTTVKSDLIAASRGESGMPGPGCREENRASLLLLLSKPRVIIPFLFFLHSLSVASFRCAPCTVLLLLLRLCSDFLRLSQLQVSAPLGTEAQPASVTLPPLPSLDAGERRGEGRGRRGLEHIHTRTHAHLKEHRWEGVVVQPDPPPHPTPQPRQRLPCFPFFFLNQSPPLLWHQVITRGLSPSDRAQKCARQRKRGRDEKGERKGKEERTGAGLTWTPLFSESPVVSLWKCTVHL